MIENLKGSKVLLFEKVEVFQTAFTRVLLDNVVAVMIICISVRKKEKNKVYSATHFLFFCNLYVIKPNFIQVSEESVII